MWVIGGSAGGYGGTLGLQRISETFPSAEVHLLADSAPFITPSGGRYDVWKNAWKLRFPNGCTGCDTRFGGVVDTLVAENASRRIGLLASTGDAVISAFFAYDATAYGRELTDLIDKSYQAENAHAFVIAGTTHGMLDKLSTATATNGAKLSDFVVGWALDLPTFENEY